MEKYFTDSILVQKALKVKTDQPTQVSLGDLLTSALQALNISFPTLVEMTCDKNFAEHALERWLSEMKYHSYKDFLQTVETEGPPNYYHMTPNVDKYFVT